jgi:perosamine synthetase
MLAGVKAGDLVVMPNITFVAPANAVKYTGADPVFIDINASTWQMDLGLLEDFLKQCKSKQGQLHHEASGRRVAAILPVHVLGNMCDMDELMRIAQLYNLPVVEDATEALGSYYKGRHAGSFGMFGCLSYNGNKLITTGGGGMIMTNDEALGKKAKHLTTQAKADPEEYYHDEIGYNYRLVNILAAMGVAQMEQLPAFLERKKAITQRYNEFFRQVDGVAFQEVEDAVKPNFWLYTIKVPMQKQLRKFLKEAGIEVRPFWVPMNRLPAFKNELYHQTEDVSGNIYQNCLSLPCSTGLTDEEQENVIASIGKFYQLTPSVVKG